MEVKLFRVAEGKMKNQCYLIHEGKTGVLVDPAWDYEVINDFLSAHQIVLKGVLLTHAHQDHVDLASTFAMRHEVPVYMSVTEIRDYNFSCPNLQPVYHLEELVIAHLTITPVVTPGHTSGSTCYQIGQHCFTGDTVFIEGVGECGIDDIDALYNSVQFFKNYFPRNTLIWPGHSFGISSGKELDFLMSNNLYFMIDEKNMFADFRMRKNRPDPLAFK